MTQGDSVEAPSPYLLRHPLVDLVVSDLIIAQIILIYTAVVQLRLQKMIAGIKDIVRIIDMHVKLAGKGGSEEGKPYDMIPMQMREKNMHAQRLIGALDRSLQEQILPQRKEPRASVEHDKVILQASNLDAGGIAAVDAVLTRRSGKRSPCAPYMNEHR